MGHKVHPYSFRLGYIKSHRSLWFAKKAERLFPKKLRNRPLEPAKEFPSYTRNELDFKEEEKN